MLRNHFITAIRNLQKHRVHSIINITGLAAGMAVALLIGLWVWDEMSFDRSFKNYDRIAQVWEQQKVNGAVSTFPTIPFPIGKELRRTYGGDFKYVVMASNPGEMIISSGEQRFSKNGIFMDADAPKMLSLKMLQGNPDGLRDPHSVLISASTALALFGNKTALNNVLKINNDLTVKVTGVYEDLPENTSFYGTAFIAPWSLYAASADWIIASDRENKWDNNAFLLYVQLADHADFATVERQIVDLKQQHVAPDDRKYQTRLVLHPMRDWALRSNWNNNGVKEGGFIVYVRLFSIIGLFVVLLACINFMNLSTARSERRAREVGIRKTIGSGRTQIIWQFYCESLAVVAVAFVMAVILGQLALPFFNQVAGKHISIPLSSWTFWITGIGFVFVTGLVAGSYPAFYLSSFRPIKVLKGTFRAGRLAALPRKALVVFQFVISVILVIGTIVVYYQVQYTKNRPLGYDSNGLVMIQMTTADFYTGSAVLRDELKRSGAIRSFAESFSPLTGVYATNDGFSWSGSNPDAALEFVTDWVTTDFGRTVGWQFVAGRDFSRDMPTDSSAVVINEAAVKFMGLKDPVGTYINWNVGSGVSRFKVIGVIRDMVMESPFQPVRQSFYFLNTNLNFIILKLNPDLPTSVALTRIAGVFKRVIRSAPFDYKFADAEYAAKFAAEERIGKLSSFFASLAIIISCLGLLGLVSFVVEQRTKEIGVRKVLGASVFGLWRLLSRDFVGLVFISLCIAIPLGWCLMNVWLQDYPYRISLSWWIFAASGLGALLVTLLTVSIQSVKAALMNPVRSLRRE